MLKTIINEDGSSSVEVITGEPLLSNGTPVLDSKGSPVMQSRKWECSNIKQTEKHVPTWSDPSRPTAERLSSGDKSAFLDQCNEIKKQLAS